MNIERFRLKNFRNFTERELCFHPQFNLVVGDDEAGKTALLDALCISVAMWLTGFKSKMDKKGISKSDATHINTSNPTDTNGVSAWPVQIEAHGSVLGSPSVSWTRLKKNKKGNTRHSKSNEFIQLSELADSLVRSGDDVILPLIGYYGSDRLHGVPGARSRATCPEKIGRKVSRLEGYKLCVDPKISVKTIVRWFARQAWIDFQRRTNKSEPSLASNLMKNSVVNCIEEVIDVFFNPEQGELMFKVGIEGTTNVQPFDGLSDGTKNVSAMIMDIVHRAMLLNPDLGQDVLKQTPGIILVDELESNLHPSQQQTIIENLRQTFPKIQFICTTNSPLLVQSIHSKDELIVLNS